MPGKRPATRNASRARTDQKVYELTLKQVDLPGYLPLEKTNTAAKLLPSAVHLRWEQSFCRRGGKGRQSGQ
jgi:hypothetical protein